MAAGPDDWWERLRAALDDGTDAVEVAPGRIEVALPGSGRRVGIVMTPAEWDEMATLMFGGLEPALDHVKETLLRLQPHQSYAVYGDYRLEPSTAPTLQSFPEAAPTVPGEWVVRDRGGRVVSRFSEWRDPDGDA